MSFNTNPFDVAGSATSDNDPLGLDMLQQHKQPSPAPGYVAQPYHQQSKKQGQYAGLPNNDSSQPPSYSSSTTDAFYNSNTNSTYAASTQPSTEQLQYIAPPIAQPYIPPPNHRNDKIQDNTASPYTTSSLTSTARFYQLPYYMSYFDVNTDELVRRLWLSFDFVHEFYLVRQGSSVPAIDEYDLPTSDNPAAATTTTTTQQYKQVDLYAPFWLTTTLLFITTVTSNIASYISTRQANKNRSVDDQTVWTSDFAITSAATTTFYCYLLVWAPILYFVQRRITGSARYTLPYIISIYGYSLSAYIPAAILAIIPNTIVRWCVIGVAGAISSLFAVRNIYNPEVTFSKQLTVLLMSLAATVLLMFSMRLYFFNYPVISIELDD